MITYPVVQHESISCVPPRWKCRHPSQWPPKMKTPEPPLRRNPMEIVQYVQYRNAPQYNTNANSRLFWLLTTSFNADDCSSCVTSNPLVYIYYCQRFAVERCLFAFLHARADCTVSPTNATGGQIALTRGCDAWLIDCKWHKQQANSERKSGASTKLHHSVMK